MNKALLIISGIMLVALVSAGIIYHYQSSHTEFNKSIEATVTHGGGGGGGDAGAKRGHRGGAGAGRGGGAEGVL